MTLAKHGLTEQTLKNLMFGAGVYFKNLKFQTDQWIGTVLGATSGGGKTSYEPQYQDAELDGALVKLRNGTFKMGETCVMTMTVTEISEGVIPTALHLELASAQNATGYKKYVSKPSLDDKDYLENMAFVGELTSGKRVIFIMENALCTSALELESKDKEQATFELTFECSQVITADDLRVLPIHVYFPDELGRSKVLSESEDSIVSEV